MRISHQRKAVGPGHRKGGALAPPESRASLPFSPRLPHSLLPQAVREARENDNQRAL
jgi:hypothetical protein